MYDNYQVLLESEGWNDRPIHDMMNKWRGLVGGQAKAPVIRLGDLVQQLSESGFKPEDINVELTPETLELLVFPKSIAETGPSGTSLEVTVQFKAVHPTLAKEVIHITELLKDLADFESAGFPIEAYDITTTDGHLYTFMCEGNTSRRFLDYIAEIGQEKIKTIKETFKNHPTTKYHEYTKVVDNYFYIQMHFHSGETL